MKLFVSTKHGQGKRKNDFCWVPEDEIVKLAMECDDDGPDGHCGCKRSLSGIDCQKATTTFKVVNLPISKDEFVERLVKSYTDGGWGAGQSALDIRATNLEEANELIRMAKTFPIGTVCEKRGPDIQSRGKIKLQKKT